MDPLLIALAAGVAVVIIAAVVKYAWRRYAERRQFAWRARELRVRQQSREAQLREMRTLAAEIVATSSTGTIVGFELVRQIEAIFSEGHKSPAEAVEGIKALARLKGANAIIHLHSERLASGTCQARGDAVVVRASGAPPEA